MLKELTVNVFPIVVAPVVGLPIGLPTGGVNACAQADSDTISLYSLECSRTPPVCNLLYHHQTKSNPRQLSRMRQWLPVARRWTCWNGLNLPRKDQTLASPQFYVAVDVRSSTIIAVDSNHRRRGLSRVAGR